MRSRGLITFFVLTYAGTWMCWIPIVAMSDWSRTPPTSLWLLGVFMPSLVALALTAWDEGRAGVEALLARIGQWRTSARWYLFAVGYMVAIKLAVAVLQRIAVGSWPRFGPEGPIVMLAAVLVSTPVQAGEEIGWRGYALPRLAQRVGFRVSGVVLGVIWAAWHLPQFFLAAADTYRQSFPIWAVEVTALSIAMTWLYAHTNGSLLLTMLMHAAVNNTKDIVPAAADTAAGTFSLNASLVMYLTAVAMWIAGAYFLVRMPQAQPLLTTHGSRPAGPMPGV
jgi:uncharacterized protein